MRSKANPDRVRHVTRSIPLIRKNNSQPVGMVTATIWSAVRRTTNIKGLPEDVLEQARAVAREDAKGRVMDAPTDAK